MITKVGDNQKSDKKQTKKWGSKFNEHKPYLQLNTDMIVQHP